MLAESPARDAAVVAVVASLPFEGYAVRRRLQWAACAHRVGATSAMVLTALALAVVLGSTETRSTA